MDYRNRHDGLLLEKAVGLAGICSYKDAFEFVKKGRVTVDGQQGRCGQIVSRSQVEQSNFVFVPSASIFKVSEPPDGRLDGSR